MKCLATVDGLFDLCQQATPLTIRTGAILTPPDFEFDTVSSFLTEDDYLAAIAAGNAYPLPLIMDQENQDAEDTVFEGSTGEKVFQYEGTRGQMWKFVLPLDLHKILKSQYSLKGWRIIEIDKNGNLIGTSADGVKVKGFKLSYFRVLKQETPGADSPAFTPIEFQKANIKEYDVYGVYGQPNWLPSDLVGAQKVVLTPSAVAANVFTATVGWTSSSEIDADTGALKTVAIPDLTAANFKVIDQTGALLVADVGYTVTESEATPGTYTVDASVGGLVTGSVQIIATSTSLYTSDAETLSA